MNTIIKLKISNLIDRFFKLENLSLDNNHLLSIEVPLNLKEIIKPGKEFPVKLILDD